MALTLRLPLVFSPRPSSPRSCQSGRGAGGGGGGGGGRWGNRTPKPADLRGVLGNALASWSAAVVCRFRFRGGGRGNTSRGVLPARSKSGRGQPHSKTCGPSQRLGQRASVLESAAVLCRFRFHGGGRGTRAGAFYPHAAKAAEDSRTPKPADLRGVLGNALASWSAAVVCRFRFRGGGRGTRGGAFYPHAAKAAEDSRTPKPADLRGVLGNALASWSAAVVCRFRMALTLRLPLVFSPRPSSPRSCQSGRGQPHSKTCGLTRRLG